MKLLRSDLERLEKEKEELRQAHEAERRKTKTAFDAKIEELTGDIEKLSKDFTTVNRELQKKEQEMKAVLELQDGLKKREENLQKTKVIISKLKNAFESFELSFACSNCSELQSDPVLLSCGHSVCKSCSEKTPGSVRCERCKKDTERSEVVESKLLSEITVKFKYSRQCLSELDVFPV